MPYETVQSVLDRALDFHRYACAFYDRMAEVVVQPRAKMLVSYLSQHERTAGECLLSYKARSDKAVLDTWYRQTPHTATRACFEGKDLHPDTTIEDIVELALFLDNCLSRLYRGMAQDAGSVEVRELFTKLLQFEEQEKHQVVRDAIEMQDL